MEDIRIVSKKWQTIYPAYINSKCTVEGGRRVPLTKAVENPTIEEISDICKYLKLGHVIEPDKAYSRDWMQKGRIKVLLKDEHGKTYHPEVTNSIFLNKIYKKEKKLLMTLCELIPKLKSRVEKGIPQAQTHAESEQEVSQKKKKRRK